MKFSSPPRDAFLRSKYFRHKSLFYQHAVPDLFPLYSHAGTALESVQRWFKSMRNNPGDVAHSFGNLLDSEFTDGLIRKQLLLEKQRLEVTLSENPGFVLQYGEQLHNVLGMNHNLVTDYARSVRPDKLFNSVIVSAEFYYAHVGSVPQQWFGGSFEWWELMEMIRGFGVELPPEHQNPVPRTGLLSGEAFWQAIANLYHGRVFFPLDLLNESGDGGATAGGGGGSGAGPGPGAGSGSGSGQGYLGGDGAGAADPVAPSGPTIGADGSIQGETNPPAAPETEEEGGWWSSLTNAVSNMSLSDIVHTTLDVVGLIPGLGEVADGLNALIYLAEGNYADAALSAAAMIPGAGAAATAAKYAKKTGLGKAMLKGGKKVVSKVDNAASKLKNGKSSAKVKETCVGGCPISMVTGEELLQFTDFELPGRLPFKLERTYRTGHDENHGLGIGWTFSGCESVQADDDALVYHTDEARQIRFPNPALGETVGQAHEQLFLTRVSENRLELETASGLIRCFEAQGSTWRLVAYRKADGAALAFRYRNNRLHRIETSCGRALVFNWSEANVIAAVSFDNGRGTENDHPVMRFEYSAERDLIANYDALNLGEQYRYRNHVLVQRTLRTGFNYYFEWDRYDTDARCLHNWGDGGNYDVRFAWYPEQNRSEITDSLGHTIRYQYNELGQLVSETDPLGNTTRYERNLLGAVTQTTQPNGAVEETTYDDFGRVRQHRQTNGAVTAFAYDAQGDPTHFTDANGYLHRRVYNEQRQVIETIDPVGSRSFIRYDAEGLPEHIQRADGSELQLRWSQRGELIEEIHPDGRTYHYTYDDFGRTESVREGTTVTRYAYDAIGRVVAVTKPDGTSMRLGYHANDLVSHLVDQNGAETRYEYADGLNQVTKRINPDGSVVLYAYDTERNLKAITNENGDTHQFFYNGAEQLVKEITFDGRTLTFEYDSNGFLTHQYEGPLVTQFKRDSSGQLRERISRNRETGEQTHCNFAYDAGGRLTKADNSQRKLRFIYDALGRLVEEWQDNHVLTHAYDAVGRQTGMGLPTGHNLRYDLNPAGGRIATWLNDRCVAQSTFDQNGMEHLRLWGNQLEEHRSFDPNGRLRSMQLFNQRNKERGAVAQRTYDYDAAGQVTRIDDFLRGSIDYAYDARKQLTKVSGSIEEVFAFDPAGNPIDRDASPQTASVAGNRMTRLGGKRFEYDAFGNQTRVVETAHGQSERTFIYGPDNQLSAVTCDGLTTTFDYDALGRRVRKHKGAVSTEFLWHNNAMVAEREGEHADWKVFVYEPDQESPLAMAQGDRLYFYHNDHLGTPQELTDEQGECVWAARYLAYGRVAEMLVERVHNPLRFPGQYYDDETGLSYNRHRYYDPDQGRFIHQDPLGLMGGLNPYSYAPNPVNWTDPLGLKCGETIDPNDVNFSQRTVSGNVKQYVEDMKNDNWDWEKSGPLKVMERDGQIVSYDNRRLMAAQQAGVKEIPIERVNPDDIMPGSKKTWDQAFTKRFNDPRNKAAGGAVPNKGLKEQPKIASAKPKKKRR